MKGYYSDAVPLWLHTGLECVHGSFLGWHLQRNTWGIKGVAGGWDTPRTPKRMLETLGLNASDVPEIDVHNDLIANIKDGAQTNLTSQVLKRWTVPKSRSEVMPSSKPSNPSREKQKNRQPNVNRMPEPCPITSWRSDQEQVRTGGARWHPKNRFAHGSTRAAITCRCTANHLVGGSPQGQFTSSANDLGLTWWVKHIRQNVDDSFVENSKHTQTSFGTPSIWHLLNHDWSHCRYPADLIFWVVAQWKYPPQHCQRFMYQTGLEQLTSHLFLVIYPHEFPVMVSQKPHVMSDA